jgi:hypothetical protein
MAIADRALMTTQLRDTRRRAELRGREAVAQWRIKSAVWAGRLYTVMFIALSIVPLLNRGGPNWASAIVMVIIAAGLLFATERMRTGSRAAAIVVLCIAILTKLADWRLSGAPLYAGAVWTLILIGALVNGVWGTLILARVRRDAALVPPAPTRPDRPSSAV